MTIDCWVDSVLLFFQKVRRRASKSELDDGFENNV